MKNFPITEDYAGEDRRLPVILAPGVHIDPPSNHRRSSANPVHRAYPWLLLASTTIATAFCLMYITKPVIRSAETSVRPPPASAEKISQPVSPAPITKAPALAPGNNHLPGDPAGDAPVLVRPNLPAFEETNLGIQHVLNARNASGNLSRIVLDVPVLYQSRQLRWTQEDAAAAREILARLADYQEKSTALRNEGAQLLSDWQILVNRTIPSSELRADSPSLPANQRDASTTRLPAALDSSESIQLKPAAK